MLFFNEQDAQSEHVQDTIQRANYGPDDPQYENSDPPVHIHILLLNNQLNKYGKKTYCCCGVYAVPGDAVKSCEEAMLGKA